MALDETARLLDDALAGGDEARGALLERLRPRVVLWAATRMSHALRAKVDPEDVAQEVLLAVHRDLDRFEARSPQAFYGWLFRIAENRIRDLVDYHGATKRKLPPPASFHEPSPATLAGLREQVHEIRTALEGLRPEHQEVIRLRRLQAMDTKQVAEILQRSENAVRVLYCRAVRALGEALDHGSTVRDP